MTVEHRVEKRIDDRRTLKIQIGQVAAETSPRQRIRVANLWNEGTQSNRPFTVQCFTRDISAGGLSFSVHFRPSVGTVLSLSVIFHAPKRVANNLIGRVAWVKQIPNSAQHVVGVDLRRSDSDSLDRWKALVAERTA
ncbi:MAG: PilZ domain-containing protein [bacterium]